MGKKIREEKDQEGGMARVEIDSIERAVKNLKKKITSSDQQLPAWVQSKITRGADYLNSASQYLMSGEDLDEQEQKSISFNINPKPKPQPKPQQSQQSQQPSNQPRRPFTGTPAYQKFVNDFKDRWDNDNSEEFSKFRNTIKKINDDIARENQQKNQQQTQQTQQTQQKPKGPQLPRLPEEKTLVNKILEEMGCECEKEMKSHKSPKEIAKKHKVPLDEIMRQLKAGIKVEYEHTNDKKDAEIIALQHLNERPDYYSRLKKVESTNENMVVRDMFGNVKYEFIDLVKADPIISEAKKRRTRKKKRKNKKMKGEDPCWSGYEMVGKKMKGGKEVPNCVPINEFLTPVQSAQLSLNQTKKVPPISTNINRIDKNIERENIRKKQEILKIERAKSNRQLPYSGETGLPMGEETIPMKNGQIMFITVLWRGKTLAIQMFFPQTRMPNRSDVQSAVDKVYPEGRVITYRLGSLQQDMPLIQIQNSPSKNYKLNSGIIGENYIEEAGPSLSVGRGEKLSVRAGGGLTAKGRKKYNRATGSHLKAPVTGKVKPGSKAAKRRKSFCARSRGWKGPRGLAARRRWKC